MKSRAIAAFVLLLLCVPALSQQMGGAVVQKATDLKAEPYVDAATVFSLPEKAQVKVLGDPKGGWLRVQYQKLNGWVRLFAIRMDPQGAQSSSGSGAKEAVSLALTGSSGRSTATGVRGLSAKQVDNAQPNPAELEKLPAFSATKTSAEKFAAGKPALQPQSIDYVQ
jgi:hypothetical protein